MSASVSLWRRAQRWPIVLGSFLLFLLITGAVSLRILDYGLDTPQPIGAFLNNTFPTEAPSSSSAWTSVVAFPNLTFTDPLQLLEVPYSNRFLMVGKTGLLWHFAKDDTTTATKTTILDIESQVLTSGDAGLLGAALHPEYGQPGSPHREYLYLWYRAKGPTASGNLGYLKLSRFNWVPGSNQVTPNSEYVMIQQYDRHQWHNGGGMFFGLDGFLYISVGDEGGANDQYNNGQKINEGLLAGVLRIDVDMDPARSHPIIRQPLNPATPPSGWPNSFSQGYYIPNDNPWPSPGGTNLEEFFAIGLRSPHRMTLDPNTGDIWLGDIGQGTREEISRVVWGANLQWPYKEGAVNGPKAQPSPLIGIDQPPVYDYPRSVGSCVIGGMVYRGNKWNASIGGKYIFGDHTQRKVWAMDYDPATGSTQIDLLTTIPAFGTGSKNGISTFATDSLGELYILKLFGTNLDGGKIYKLRPQNYSPEPPQFLSQTGAFSDLTNLTPSAGLIPYTVNSPLWSDGAEKKRWIAIPNNGSHNTASEQVIFSENAEWTFPTGTVFIKHFEMPLDENNPTLTRRLETRFLVRDQNGGVYGITYKWNAAQTDAELLLDSDTIHYTYTRANLSQENRVWTFPSRADCMTCHNENAQRVLGVKTHQLNGEITYPGTGITDNQLRTWNHLGIFSSPLNEADIATMPQAAPLGQVSASLERRIRSYLDANCAHCHRPNGVNAGFDARYPTPLVDQNLVHGDLIGSYGLSRAAIIKPQDYSRSILQVRDKSLNADAMPPLAKSLVDETYISVLRAWIDSLDPGCEPVPIQAGTYSLKYADSEETSGPYHPASFAFDDNPETFWHTEWVASDPLPPHELQLDLGDTVEVAGFRYLPRQDGNLNGTIADYAFYVSLDGINWGTPLSSGTFAANKSEKEVLSPTRYGRYVRLVALAEVNGNPWTSVAEFHVLRINGDCVSPGGQTTTPTLWLSADEYGGPLSNGSPVTEWQDRSPSANIASQSEATGQPAYFAALLNGHGMIRFDGNNDWLKLNGAVPTLSDSFSLFTVIRPLPDTDDGFYLSSHLGGSNRTLLGHKTNGQLFYQGSNYLSTQNYHNEAVLVHVTTEPDVQMNSYLNGNSGNGLSSFTSTGADRASLGQEFDGSGNDNQTSNHWAGEMAEIILLPGIVSSLDREKAESYLALKYGLHLSHHYWASDWNGSTGTQVWNIGGGYDEAISGFGRDDHSGLDQRQAQGQNQLVAMYHGYYSAGGFPTQNSANPHGFVLDRSFLLWGNDNGGTSSLSQTIYTGANQRIGRVWRVQKTGEVGLVTLKIDKSALPLAASALYLNRNGDTAFPHDPNTLVYSLLDGGSYWYTAAQLEDGDVFSFGNGSGITFPVEWLNISVQQLGEDAQLNWTTARETQSDFFAIERSVDGKVFEQVGKRRASGTSVQQQSYTFDDPRVVFLPSQQLLYRIRQVDLDGSFGYSNTVALNLERTGSTLALYLAPNPADEQVELLIQSGTTEYVQVRIFNAMGQEVYQQELSKPDETERLEVPVHNWTHGIYFVRLESSLERVVKKLVVQ